MGETSRPAFMKRILCCACALGIFLALAAGCSKSKAARRTELKPSATTNHAALAGENILVERFLDSYLAWRPNLAVGLGLHAYDGRISDLTSSSVKAEKARLLDFEKRFTEALAKSKSGEESLDLRLALSLIQQELLHLEGGFENSPSNPMTYASALDPNLYLKRDYAPLDQRVRAVVSILDQAPALFRTARMNLGESLPRPHVETAIQMAQGAAAFLLRDLPLAVEGLKDPVLRGKLDTAALIAHRELTHYVAWLEEQRLPKAHQHFALGRETFSRMLKADLIDLSPEAILELGFKQLRAEQAIFAETARQIDPAKKPAEVYRAIQKDHPSADKLLEETRRGIEAIRKFVVDRKVATIPSEVRVKIEETPRYARATSFASMDTPGPFEKSAAEAYYYITPVEPDWPPAQQEEWLTAFNRYTTDVVSIHEAYPGHYTQFLWVNATPLNRLRKIYVSYAFSEGWAHYAEQMLIDEGFGKAPKQKTNDVRALKYRLAQSGEALLRLCRLCASIQMHCSAMSLDEAAAFFETQCYYESKPARQEAVRGTFDPGYLYYSLGKMQWLKLREDFARQEGKDYTLLKFHDAGLASGSPPIRLLREKLLKDPSKWAETL